MRPVLCRLFIPLIVLTAGFPMYPPVAASGLVSNLEAERHGLVRAWFSQAQVDRTQHRVEQAILAGDQLFVLTTAGVLHAMDAETGQTDWVARIGDPNYPSLGPSANEKYIALVNGSTVTVLDRANGLELMHHELTGGAGGGPALTNDHVYVPMFTGKIEAYPLNEEAGRIWYYASTGRVFDSPIATSNSVIWPTDRGFLYVAKNDGDGVRFRFESSGQMNPEPVVADGTLYATSSNGYLYAIDEQSGQQRWRYSTGDSIIRSPVAVSGRLYVATEEPGLHAVATEKGRPIWESPGIVQLLAVTKSRVYGLSRKGDIVVLDLASGVPLGRLHTSAATHAVVNDQTDRLYLIGDTGLVQCLHELGADEPMLHTAVAPAEAPPGDEPQTPAAERPAEPAGEDPADEPPARNPFDVPAADNPFGGEAPTDNPFDF